jgi:pantoate--beta-alanine ligase
LEIIKDIIQMQDITLNLKKENRIIGFVPTMGYLHEGHMSLINRAKKETGKVVISIFVNPIQFSPTEDFKKYPRDPDRDFKMSGEAGADYIFCPGEKEMYEKNFRTFVEVKKLEKIMCGNVRPGHFRGVCTVVLKLFNIVKPDLAYFGEKDYQQLVLIKKMSKDLNLPVEIIGCPIIRETDGLALSSRNKYLTHYERENAPVLYRSLKFAGDLISCKKEKDLKKIKNLSVEKLISNPAVAEVDYFDFRDPVSLEEIKKISDRGNHILIASAVKIGKTRLIDNIIVDIC